MSLTLNVRVQCLVLLSSLSTITPLGGDLIWAHFFQFHIPVDNSQVYISRVYVSSEAQTCTSSRGSTPPPGCPVGISDSPVQRSAPHLLPDVLSSHRPHPLVFHGNTVLVVQARSLGSSLMPLSHTPPSSQSVTPVGSISHIPRLRHTYPAPLPTPGSTHLAYSRSHPTGLLASLAPLPT